ncbi:hypothetical protein ADIS_1630 [Lunatimonas lonarensis]|uniref:Uncharacterized protein n=1 Tax=Lunatimonas lonarensis TaxID=1232681 RepID=R7ZV09_9BACT|nr:hypothetical protein ADIS_1630 [Lunatimonas lonarensis]
MLAPLIVPSAFFGGLVRSWQKDMNTTVIMRREDSPRDFSVIVFMGF